MRREHIVKSYDQELEQLKSYILQMGYEAMRQLDRSVEVLINRDEELAQEVIRGDDRVNKLQNEIDNLTVRLIATRQPMAVDLRHIISGLKIAADLERIADNAARIAKHIKELNHIAFDKPIELIISMAELIKNMLRDLMEAYEEMDVNKAIMVWEQDRLVDRIYSDLLVHLRDFINQDAVNINAYTSLIFVARSWERVGDHIKNMAEDIHYIVMGEPYQEAIEMEI
ncbi:MAG TPA: phosphate signaling complex protein PhoU [Thermodesulfovibrionia bacterium]|nr:phosphate signaling complex protein PhoU [Thermodesulfovibrionia bacterium]